ncbi:MAG: hypothetical protein K2W78_11715 [Xanthobacteraceae bacterium]|nr:hypothetical protein [Xanthobacteraceae bacterium]
MGTVRCTILVAMVALMASADVAFARGGGAQLLNSPGYQRALQESRKTLGAQPDHVRPSAETLRKKRKRRH